MTGVHEAVPIYEAAHRIAWFDDTIGGGLTSFHQYDGPVGGRPDGTVYIPGALQSEAIARRVTATTGVAPESLRDYSVSARMGRLALVVGAVKQPPVFLMHKNVTSPQLSGIEPAVLAEGLRYMCQLVTSERYAGVVSLRFVQDEAITGLRELAGVDNYVLMRSWRGASFAALNDIHDIVIPGSPRLAQVMRLDQNLAASPHVLDHQATVDRLMDAAQTLDPA